MSQRAVTTRSEQRVREKLPYQGEKREGTTNIDYWAKRRGLLPWLLPFEGRDFDPIEFMATLRQMFEDAPPTKKDIRLSAVTKQCDIVKTSTVRRHIWRITEMLGSWFRPKVSGSDVTRVANPNYVHIRSMPDDEIVSDPYERCQLIRRLSKYGIVHREDIANRCGVKKTTVKDFLHRYEIPWSEWKKQGLKALVRTQETAIAWGVSRPEFGEAIGHAPNHMRKNKSRHIPDHWTPPADPTYKGQ